MPRDLTTEPLFPTDDIQGDILVGLLKKVERFVFFRVTDGELFAAFMKTLEITSMQDCLDQRAAVAASKAVGSTALVSTPGLNVAFTHAGLQAVGVNGADRSTQFAAGMAASAGDLGDPDPDPASPALLGAQMVGRWKSGAALINAPRADDPALGDGTSDVNNFEFGGDREGVLCPWAAHIRKAYPRDDVRGNTTPDEETVDAAEAFTQTHRMLRRGIAYGGELTEDEALSGSTTEDRGLLFACYVTDISNQFEFVQRAWVNAVNFSQDNAGVDAIIGQGGGNLPWRGAAPFSKRPDHKPDLTFARFVHMQGGEYFFASSIPALRTLPGT